MSDPMTPAEIAALQRLCDAVLSAGGENTESAAQLLARYARHLEAQASRAELSVSDAQIKHMVDRFLGWRLPQPWHPDNGISYQRPGYAHAVSEYDWPTGTNLFDANEAEAMVRYMLEGIPVSRAEPSKSSIKTAQELALAVKAYGIKDSAVAIAAYRQRAL